jgi:hypothetical protein
MGLGRWAPAPSGVRQWGWDPLGPAWPAAAGVGGGGRGSNLGLNGILFLRYDFYCWQRITSWRFT